MKRRQFVGNAGLVFVGLQFGALSGCGDASPDVLAVSLTDDRMESALRTVLGGVAGIGFIGPVCARRLEPSFDRAAFAAELRTAREAGPESIGEAIRHLVAVDFRSGRIEEVEGWQLSRTECRLAALAAIEQGLDSSVLAEVGALTEAPFVEVRDWGPDFSYQGQAFNPQSGGRGGVWVRTLSPSPPGTVIVVGPMKLETHVQPDVLTGILSAEATDRLVSEPGVHEVLLVDEARRRMQAIGTFTVREAPTAAMLEDGRPSEVFCEIEQWGPVDTTEGAAFNQQPDGSSSFWILTGCAPKGTRVLFGEHELSTSTRVGMVSARVDEGIALPRGGYPLRLFDPESGEIVEVGTFTVN